MADQGQASVALEDLPLDEREKVLAAMPEEHRERWRNSLDTDTAARLEREAAEHMQGLASRTPLFGDTGEQHKVDGNPEGPQDRDPDADPPVIRELVGHKVRLERELAAAHAELDRYYQAFGKLPD